MDSLARTVGLVPDLADVGRTRQYVASALSAIADTIAQAETVGSESSGKLELDSPIADVRATSTALAQGIFRLVVLGDMKRGKSTFLNALLGENLLPSDVNPCTALLTVLKYGPEKQVTIHFNDGKAPDQIDFQTFKQHYVIDPEEAKQLEAQQELAFPDVSYAVVEYPLPLLEQGIELVDTPGLNDTEARNQQVLHFLNDCQAVLFVLNATQPCTLDERRYLNNYLKDRGLTTFFLINGWDRVRTSLVNPDDVTELAAAEDKLRQVFHTHLADHCQLNGEDLYSQRVFEVSALEALRQRLRNPDGELIDTGFPEFLASLKQFLAHDRAWAELKRAEVTARSAYRQVCEAVDRRIPLLDQTAAELKQSISSVQTEFTKLEEIRDKYQQLIRITRDRQAKETADSFKAYILQLEQSFETDFVASQPDLDFLKFLEKNNRAAFYTAFKRAFERYMNDRLAAWEFLARQDLGKAFSQLNTDAVEYQDAYAAVVEVMNEKLLGDRFYAAGHNYNPEETSIWVDNIKDLFESIPDTLNDTSSRFNLFWQSVLRLALVYVCVYVALYILGIIFSSLILNIVGVLLVGGGVIAAQAEVVRQQFLSTTRREFVKYLPQIASEQWRSVYEAVEKCFDTYEEQVMNRINADINSRKAELDNLLAQKESHSINREAEIARLTGLKETIADQLRQIEVVL